MDGKPEFEIRGRGAETMIFIPALGTTRDMWKEQATFFQERYRVLLYDAGGHDRPSSGRMRRSLADFAEELHELIEAARSERPHIIGISMGGMIAQEFAIRFPAEPASLVLASTTASYPQEQRDQLELRARTAESEGMSPLVEPTLGRWFTDGFRQEHPKVVDRIRRMLETADPAAYAEAARAVARVNTAPMLSRISCPVLVVAAEHDQSMPPDAAAALAREIPHARSATIRSAAHLCSVEQPEEFNRTVLHFMGSAVRTKAE